MRGYFEKISEQLPFKQEYAGEYDHYDATMDAICSRKPFHMKENGMAMLKAKVCQLTHPDLRRSAGKAYDELAEEVEKLN